MFAPRRADLRIFTRVAIVLGLVAACSAGDEPRLAVVEGAGAFLQVDVDRLPESVAVRSRQLIHITEDEVSILSELDWGGVPVFVETRPQQPSDDSVGIGGVAVRQTQGQVIDGTAIVWIEPHPDEGGAVVWLRVGDPTAGLVELAEQVPFHWTDDLGE